MRCIAYVVMLATVLGCSLPAISADEMIPDIKGLQPFTRDAKYMSLAGYLRWKYHEDNGEWITRVKAEELAKMQQVTTTTAETEE